MAEGPTVSMSFANNFWGKEDAGVHPLLERMHNAKMTCDELKNFYNTRASIEEEYAKKLLALCRKPLGSAEAGSLRASLDVTRGEVESIGKAHQAIAAQMRTELEEPLAAFAGGMKERRKIVQISVEKLFKTKQQQTQAVNKSRDRYEQDCLKIKGYLAQGHMVMGQEERKNKAKMEKTQIQLASASNEYEAAVKVLEDTTGRWNREWKAACDKFQDLEEERLDFSKSSLWTFANVASTVCVSDDASCEKIRLSLEQCEVEKDICTFIREHGTGQEIQDPPKYINFCRGDVNDTASEASEEDHYSVAQFPRAMNPAYRSSSPQPLAGSLHPDDASDSGSRVSKMGGKTPPSREPTLTPQHAARQQAPPPFNNQYNDNKNNARLKQEAVENINIPHNEYPPDGMTMLCRRDQASSDVSSALSHARPSSRDSHSECSNPTSLSSFDPVSGSHSPVKTETGQILPSNSPVKNIQKKRSGFFSNSPFRRKSKHEKEPLDMPTPTSRNTWGPSNTYGGANGPSPTRPSHRETHSGSPEPADPRASFQLNVGQNVFDVASPDASREKPSPRELASPTKNLDPIAAALEELKGVDKQSSVRMSADRYAGVATPGPASTTSMSTSDGAAAHRPTPPPSYTSDQNIRRLGAPEPAFTSSQMRQTTQKYVGQNQKMYGTGSRPNTRGNGAALPRATSPRPMRSTSPRPGHVNTREPGFPRAASPNPYGNGGRPRQTPNSSPAKQTYSRHNSPGEVGRSPPRQSPYGRSERPSSEAGMQMQLADAPRNNGHPPQGRSSGGPGGRPVSYYGGGGGPGNGGGGQSGPYPPSGRVRSKSMASGRQCTADGRPILQFARAMYMYRAVIPEELGFAKGDVLAVLRLQDDGWWEAEVTGKPGRGLVPSNYLQPC